MKVVKESKLKVKGFDFSCDECDNTIPEPLYKHFNWVYGLVGKAGSGKTSAMLSLIALKGKFYNKKFHNVFIVSPSMKSLKNSPLDKLPEEQKFTTLNDSIVDKLEEMIEQNGERNLIIWDDIPMLLKSAPRHVADRITHMIYNRRHFANDGDGGSLSMMFLFQVYISGIPLQIRKSFDGIMWWRSSNKKEIETLREEWGNMYSKEQWKRLISFAWQGNKHNFLFIKTRVDDSQMFHKNFDLIGE